jgi:ribonuclease R
MLPEVLSNDLCSLVEAKDRLTFGAVFEMTPTGEIVSEWFGRTVINSDKRFTYEEAQEIIEAGEGLHAEAIITLNTLAKVLLQKRFAEGAITLDTKEVKFKLDENSFPIGVYVKERKDAHKMIEEWMLLANKQVAHFVAEKAKKTPNVFVYRVHGLPEEDRMLDLATFLQNLGHKIHLHDGQIRPKELNDLLQSLEGKPEKDIVQTHVTRSMQKAIYSTHNIGHYGLAFKDYTHFTSPIRRYADVMVHRLLDLYLSGGSLDEKKWGIYDGLCAKASSREKEAADAERSSIKYKQVEYMTVRVGQEFDGVVSGLTDWGVFVEEKESRCEGLIRLKDLGDDFFSFDEKKYEITGEKYKQKFTLGMPLRIKVLKADLETKTIDYTLVKEEEKKA